MGVIRPIDVLQDVALALVEQPVSTSLNSGGAIAAGTATVTPGSMVGIYPGALLVIAYRTAVEELITVTSMTASTFTATFVNSHAGTDPVLGVTFPSGQTDHPLFTQAEMLGYLADVQMDFLLKVRPIYKVATAPLVAQKTVYPNPSDAIRIERISVTGTELFNVEQSDIDFLDPGWTQSSIPPNPRYWYQDGVKLSYGISPVIQRNDTAELMYSQNSASSLGFLDTFLVPDVMTFIFKYGVLGRAWSKDGETRDLNRAQFCQQWYEMFSMVTAKFLYGVQARIQSPDETVEPLLQAMGGK